MMLWFASKFGTKAMILGYNLHCRNSIEVVAYPAQESVFRMMYTHELEYYISRPPDIRPNCRCKNHPFLAFRPQS